MRMRHLIHTPCTHIRIDLPLCICLLHFGKYFLNVHFLIYKKLQCCCDPDKQHHVNLRRSFHIHIHHPFSIFWTISYIFMLSEIFLPYRSFFSYKRKCCQTYKCLTAHRLQKSPALYFIFIFFVIPFFNRNFLYAVFFPFGTLIVAFA